MPNCSAPGCRGNYTPEDRVPVFKLPDGPPELRHAWIRALHRDDIADLKTVYVCAKHFQKEDIQYFHTGPRGDGTSYEVPRGRPKLNPGAVPSLLPGCPSYYSSTPSTGIKRTRFSYDSKEEDLLNQATNLSLRSENAEMEKFRVGCIQEIRDKLALITIPTDWLVWIPTDNCVRFFLPKVENHSICADVSLVVNSFLPVNGYIYGKSISLSLISITDIQQIEMMFTEITLKLSSSPQKKYPHHISKAKEHIEEAICNLLDSDETGFHCSDLPRLQFILGQLENVGIYTKRRRYNWLNQKDIRKTFHFPNFQNIKLDYCVYPVQVHSASFSDVRLLYNSEKESLAKLAPNLTIKACFPSAIERQNVKLVLKVFNDLTVAALKLQNELSNQEDRNNTHDFVEMLLQLWKLFNINSPLKGKRLNDDTSRPLTYQDERFPFLACVVIWLETWLALPGNVGKLSKQTFTSFKHACTVLPQITNHLTGFCGFNYLLTSF